MGGLAAVHVYCSEEHLHPNCQRCHSAWHAVQLTCLNGGVIQQSKQDAWLLMSTC